MAPALVVRPPRPDLLENALPDRRVGPPQGPPDPAAKRASLVPTTAPEQWAKPSPALQKANALVKTAMDKKGRTSSMPAKRRGCIERDLAQQKAHVKWAFVFFRPSGITSEGHRGMNVSSSSSTASIIRSTSAAFMTVAQGIPAMAIMVSPVARSNRRAIMLPGASMLASKPMG
jgi:hypothetical protein